MTDLDALMKSDFVRVPVGDYEITQAQAFCAQRQKLPGARDPITQKHWTGYMAEAVFDQWLIDKGIEHEWDHDPHRFDKVEFYVPPWYTDVKCANGTVEPQMHYGCNLKKEQANNPYVSAYVHARYIEPDREMVLLGAITKVEYMDNAEFAEKGQVIEQAPGQRMTVSEDMYYCQVSCLTPLDIFFAGKPCLDCGHRNGYMDGQVCGFCWFKRRKALREAEAAVV